MCSLLFLEARICGWHGILRLGLFGTRILVARWGRFVGCCGKNCGRLASGGMGVFLRLGSRSKLLSIYFGTSRRVKGPVVGWTFAVTAGFG